MPHHLECRRRGRSRRSVGMACAAALFGAAAGCGDGPQASVVQLVDRDRHARFSADGQTVVFYRHDERPGESPGVYRLDRASGAVQRITAAILAGLDLHPQTDSIVFSARVAGETEPALWLMGLDGGGLRRLGGGGAGPGYRWPAFSTDGTRLAWEIRFQNAPDLDTVATLWMADWNDGITNERSIGPGRNSAWRPDGAALAVERRRPGGVLPQVLAVMDTTGTLLDTLGLGDEPVWRPDGLQVAYLVESETDRGCLGVCLVPASGGVPTPLSADFMSFPGAWSPDGTEFVYARLMRTYDVSGATPLRIEESRLWIRTMATGADRQVTF